MYRFRIKGEVVCKLMTPTNAARFRRRLEGSTGREPIKFPEPEQEPIRDAIPFPCSDPLCEGEVEVEGDRCDRLHSVGVSLREERFSAMRCHVSKFPAFGIGLYGVEGFESFRRKIDEEARRLFRLAHGIGTMEHKKRRSPAKRRAPF